MDTQLLFAKDNDMRSLFSYLENIDSSFQSIGYESASMAIALKDLEQKQELDDWLLFANGPAIAHKSQVYVGLGWAIAKLNLPFLHVTRKIDPRLYHRVIDGCGYYDGSFRQRQTLLQQTPPAYIPRGALTIYYQGVGRSLWYTCNADLNNIFNKIGSFPETLHPNLWRGIGIAVAYVGGCNEDTLLSLWQNGANHQIQLTRGAALAVRSRRDANLMTTETDQCFRVWMNLTPEEGYFLPIDTTDPANFIDDADYLHWIATIEKELENSFETGN